MATPGAGGARADDAAFLHAVGERLRTLRSRRGMTRRGLAQHSGVSERYIAQMEAGSGNGSILLLRALAGGLGVPLQSLLEDEPSAAHLRLQGILARLAPSEAEEARRLIAARFERAGGTGEQPDRACVRRRRVALIGLRGAGKSTLGRLLAEHRGVPFIELDREIAREAGMDLPEVFELHGQPGYRRLERAALDRVLAASDSPQDGGMILAAGGSIVAETGTFETLLAHCLTVWVRAAPAEHMQRVIDQGDFRPMRNNPQAMEDLRVILASREGLYARADLTLDTSTLDLQASFDALLRLLPASP